MFLQQKLLLRPSVDLALLSREYLPPRLPFRERELTWIRDMLGSYAESFKEDLGIVISGGAGVGKTAVVQMASRILVGSRSVTGERNISLVCVADQTPLTLHALLSEILSYVAPFRTAAGISDRELVDFLGRTLTEQGLKLVLLVDALNLNWDVEAVLDLFVQSNSKVRSRPVCVVVTARRTDSASKKSFLRQRLVVEPYSKEEIMETLRYRLKLSSSLDLVDDSAMEYVVEKAAMQGDLGYAIQLVREGLKQALKSGDIKLSLQRILEAEKSYVDQMSLSVVRGLGLHEKLLLYSLCVTLSEKGVQKVSIGELESSYQGLCLRLGVKPRMHTQVWSYIQRLCGLGVLDTWVGGREGRGRTTNIYLPHSPEPLAKELERQLKKCVSTV